MFGLVKRLSSRDYRSDERPERPLAGHIDQIFPETGFWEVAIETGGSRRGRSCGRVGVESVKREPLVCTKIVPEQNVLNVLKLGSSEKQILHIGENVAKRCGANGASGAGPAASKAEASSLRNGL